MENSWLKQGGVDYSGEVVEKKVKKAAVSESRVYGMKAPDARIGLIILRALDFSEPCLVYRQHHFRNALRVS